MKAETSDLQLIAWDGEHIVSAIVELEADNFIGYKKLMKIDRATFIFWDAYHANAGQLVLMINSYLTVSLEQRELLFGSDFMTVQNTASKFYHYLFCSCNALL